MRKKIYTCVDCEGLFSISAIAEIIDEEEKTCVCIDCDSYNKHIRS